MASHKTTKKHSDVLLSILALFVVGGLCLKGALTLHEYHYHHTY